MTAIRRPRTPRSSGPRRRALRWGTTLDPTPLRVAAMRLVAAALVAGGGWYLWWRRLTVAGTGWFGALFYCAEAVGFVMIAWTAVLLTRTRRRLDGPPHPPTGTLDVYVTVCGEPLPMVEATLRAAIAIDYPHRTYLLNDGRIADKPGWQLMEPLAASLGVTCFTRTSGARGKAGNLNHALARTDGQFVVTIDADHVADASLADATVGYLRDPNVAFVATAQRFASAGADLLNNEEPIFYHGLQPAKDADGCAFSCGNASVYRRRALDGIGGFSEWNLVEDVHTSYLLHARGWDSVYHPHPVTVGVAPVTAAVYLTQRLRWAMDSLRLLFFDSPFTHPGLSWRRRMHYLHTTGFYVLASFHIVLLLAPPLYVLWRVSVLSGFSAPEYLSNAVPYLSSIAAFLLLACGARGALGTMQGASFAWPVYGLAIVRTLIGALPSTEPTAKGRQPSFSVLMLPVMLCFGAQLAALLWGLVDRSAGGAGVALFWAGLQAFLLAAPVSALSESIEVRRRIHGSARAAVATIAVAAVVTVQVVVPRDVAPRDLVVTGSGSHGFSRQLDIPVEGAYLGITNPGLPERPVGLRSWAGEHGHRPQIVQWFQQWHSGEIRFRTDWLERVAASGAVPMITWEPWAKPDDSYRDPEQPGARLPLIVDGEYDELIRAWARGAAAYGDPLLIRFMHEMNAWWYPWAVGVNGNTAEDYVAAWRHVHDLFTEAGADNVAWVWSVNELAGIRDYREPLTSSYPGDDYVDWVGMTGFNWGLAEDWSEWREHDAIYRDTYDRLVAFGKPVMVPEIATVDIGGDGGDWIEATLEGLRRDYPLVKAVVWYDGRYSSTVDFRLRGARADGFKAAAADPHWTVPVQTVLLEPWAGDDGQERA